MAGRSIIPNVSHLRSHLCFTEYRVFPIEFINVARRLEILDLFREHNDGVVFHRLFHGMTRCKTSFYPTQDSATPSITAALEKMILPSSGNHFGYARQGDSMSEVPRGRDEATTLRRWCSVLKGNSGDVMSYAVRDGL